MYIVGNRVRTKTIRSYLKIQELIARVGGIANVFYILMRVFSYDILLFQYYKYIKENSLDALDSDFKEEKKILKIIKSFEIEKCPVKVEKILSIPQKNKLIVTKLKDLGIEDEKCISKFLPKNQRDSFNHNINKNSDNNLISNRIDYFKNENLSEYNSIHLFNNAKNNLDNNNINKIVRKEIQIQIEQFKKKLKIGKIINKEDSEILFPGCTSGKDKTFVEAIEVDNDLEFKYCNYIFSFCCCKKTLQKKFDYDLKRIKKLLEFQLLTRYLSFSYSSVNQNPENNK